MVDEGNNTKQQEVELVPTQSAWQLALEAGARGVPIDSVPGHPGGLSGVRYEIPFGPRTIAVYVTNSGTFFPGLSREEQDALTKILPAFVEKRSDLTKEEQKAVERLTNADAFEGMKGSYHHAAQLWQTARDLAERLEKAEPMLEPGRTPAGLSALLFAAFSVETFLNELGDIASRHPEDPGAVALHDALDEVEESRGSTRLKYQIAILVLTGRPVDKGSRVYQDFDLLFKVRDEIVHLKPHTYTFGGGKVKVTPGRLLDTLYGKQRSSRTSSAKLSVHGRHGTVVRMVCCGSAGGDPVTRGLDARWCPEGASSQSGERGARVTSARTSRPRSCLPTLSPIIISAMLASAASGLGASE